MTYYSDSMLNHHLSQKFKLIRNDKFNYLIYKLDSILGSNIILAGNIS
jgi:hypothetical protein